MSYPILSLLELTGWFTVNYGNLPYFFGFKDEGCDIINNPSYYYLFKKYSKEFVDDTDSLPKFKEGYRSNR